MPNQISVQPANNQRTSPLSLRPPPAMEPSPSASSVQPSSSKKAADYVYFDRTTAGFSDDAVPRAKGAQLKLEHYYKVAVEAAIERSTRCAPSPVPQPPDVSLSPRAAPQTRRARAQARWRCHHV